MPRTIFQWITIIALIVGIAAAAVDWRALAAFAFLVTVVFGLAAVNIQRRVDRYRL